ncbi:hypothetical protein OUY22_27405 [Nonomuraea sp. MCN248]|uniref:Uncharacterized protein n=1 Tax=Nonomuraea corallina TaxID=2989783 RepID=A0ABT4SJM6_9ACTN|nr:hypothetical protein [Nonomuraea corallina]MDA0637145.1 hypothetical protein [Nonomuraea corallina]
MPAVGRVPVGGLATVTAEAGRARHVWAAGVDAPAHAGDGQPWWLSPA